MDETWYLIACSGLGAMKAVAMNIVIGYCFAAGTALVALLLARFRKRTGRNWPTYYNLAFLVFHPAWTVSATQGDCGRAKVLFSGVLALVSVFFVSLEICRLRRIDSENGSD